MDERAWTPVRLAGGIWRFQRERFQHCNRGEIYPQSGAASPQDDVRAGISGVAEETRHSIPMLHDSLGLSPRFGGLSFLGPLSHRLRDGLNNSALSGLGLVPFESPGLLEHFVPLSSAKSGDKQ